MRAYVITIMDNARSVEVAKRCIQSGQHYGVNVEMWPATTPKDDVIALMEKEGIPQKGFDSIYSREANAQATFLSHYYLWQKCLELDKDVLILEHDAVFVNNLPDTLYMGLVTNIGKPSYGTYKTPSVLGLNMLTSKPYFPGAHAYVVKPLGAERLIKLAKEVPGPADIFLNVHKLPFLQEWYPWPVEVRDSFTTIQLKQGCLAKHSYKKDPNKFDII